MNNNPAFDASIPVLTEVFTDEPAPAPAPAPEEPAAALEARALADWSEPEWTLLERRVAERVLNQLQNRADFVLEQRVRDSMEEVLQQAMAELTAHIRGGLHETIGKIVSRAVAQEIAHLQALKK